MVEQTRRQAGAGEGIGPLSDPGVDEMFSANVYGRGALTLHALRLTVGDEAFFTILEEWASRYKYGNVTTEDFISLVEEVATNVTSDRLAAALRRLAGRDATAGVAGGGALRSKEEGS